MKKFLALLLASIAIMSILTACGENSPFGNKSDQIANGNYLLNEKDMTTVNHFTSHDVRITYNNARNIIIFDYRKNAVHEIKMENLDKRKTDEIVINGKTQKVYGNCVDIIGMMNKDDVTTVFVSEGRNIIVYELHDGKKPEMEIVTDMTWEELMKPFMDNVTK